MDLNAAAMFVRVVETGGFSAAARRLGCPKATISKKVADLERALGVRLLNRTTRRVSMTQAGEQVYNHYVIALQHIQAAGEAVHNAQQVPAGMLTVGAPGPLGAYFLLPAITAFMHEYPRIEITHLAIDTPVDLVTAQLDILLVVGTHLHAEENVRAITDVEIALFASESYAALQGLPARPQDLQHHQVIAPTQAMVGDDFAWMLQSGGETVSIVPETRPRLRSNDGAATLAAIVAGHGIGSLPLRFAAASPHAASLVPVLPEWRVPAIELSAIYRDGSSTSLKNRLFLDFITDWFKSP